MSGAFQIPVVILPTSAPNGTETELIDDAVEHVSLELVAIDGTSIVRNLVDKTAFVFAQELVVAGAPGNLQVWVEVSPYPSIISASYWAVLGVPVTIVGTGVNNTIHTVAIPFAAYAPYIRVVAQTAIPSLTAAWACQIMFAGQGR